MTSSDNADLFVYGSLRRGSTHPQAEFLANHAQWLGFADFQGMLFDVGAYPGAIASDDPAHRVRGDLYRLNDPLTVLAALDSYEQFGAEFPQPNEFIRALHPVAFSGRSAHAWIYLYNHPTDSLLRLGYDYLSTLQKNNP